MIEAGCTGKQRYASGGAAWKARERLNTRRWAGQPPIDAYACHICGGWHIGRPNTDRIRATMKKLRARKEREWEIHDHEGDDRGAAGGVT